MSRRVIVCVFVVVMLVALLIESSAMAAPFASPLPTPPMCERGKTAPDCAPWRPTPGAGREREAREPVVIQATPQPLALSPVLSMGMTKKPGKVSMPVKTVRRWAR